MSPICLIAESDPFLTLLLQRFVEECGLQPLHARVGEQALALLREHHPDVLVIDPELPGALRGWEVVHALKDDRALASTRVIAWAWLDPSETTALTGPIAAHLKKPDLCFADFVSSLQGVG